MNIKFDQIKVLRICEIYMLNLMNFIPAPVLLGQTGSLDFILVSGCLSAQSLPL